MRSLPAWSDDPAAVPFQVARKLERRLAAELHDDSPWLLHMHDLEHVLEREWLEVEAIRGVVIGRDGLRIAVDHDRLEAVFAQRKGGVDAAVVELDPLPDSIRPAAKNDDLLAVGRLRFALLFVGGVHVRGARREFRRAGVDALVHRPQAQRMAARTDFVLVRLPEIRQPPIREAYALEPSQLVGGKVLQLPLLDCKLGVDDLLDLSEEPAVDLGELIHLVDAHADAER